MERRRLELAGPWACALALALPACIARYLPMTDLPHQEEVVSLLRHFGDPRWEPPGLYHLNLGLPKQLFHVSACALAFVVPTDVACKLVVAASVALIPLGAAHLAAHMGRTRWAALVTAPLAIGWSFYWGLTSNLLGLGLWLFALPSLDRFAARPTARGAAAASGWMVLLYFAHESSLLLAVGALFLFVVARGEKTLLGLVPVVVGIVGGLGQQVYKAHLDLPFAGIAHARMRFVGVGSKLRSLPVVIFGQADAASLTLLCALLAACLVVLFALRRREARATSEDARSWRALAYEHRFAVLAGVCALAYLAGPVNAGYGNWVYQRFLPPAIALAACALAPTPEATRWTARAVLAGMPLAVLAVAAPTFADASRAYGELDPLIAQIEMGSSVVQLRVGPGTERVFSMATAGARAVAARGGRGVPSYAYVDYSPVLVRRECWWLDPERRVEDDGLAFEPARDLTRFRYVLLHAASPPDGALAAMALGADARVVDSSGEWLLLESTHPQLPLTAPDERPLALGEHVDTLRDRMTDVARRLDVRARAHGSD